MTGGIVILRVIAGTAKGHKLKTVEGMSTRPTTDRVKESLFNILAPYLERTSVLDLFAGTGSLGIEALSRGAASAVFADKSRDSISVIRANLEHTKLLEKSKILQEDFLTALDSLFAGNAKFDIIMLDPPYNKNFIQDTLKNLTKNDIIKDGSIIAAEHDAREELPERVGRLFRKMTRRYGDTALTFYVAGTNEVE